MESSAVKEETELPFSHGIEVELQVIKRDGSWIQGEEILSVFDRVVSRTKGALDKRIQTAQIASVKRKYKQSTQTEEGERGSRIVARYEAPDGTVREYTLIGHDPNVTSITWILEVATPPCTTIEELAWWVQTLIAVSYDSIPPDTQAIMVSTGLNPTQEYLKNLSFGEHHHILGSEVPPDVRIGVYNMIRNFIPHLIALSVNSPFESKMPTDVVELDDKGNTRAPKCKRSIRLLKNTTQLGPTSQFELIPYMKTPDKDAFAKHVNRSFARMVDMYPFTDYNTIELRVFDTQLSIPRRVGIALLLQALALKAKKMVERGVDIPDVGSDCLSANRENAVVAGMWGPFRTSKSKDSNEFIDVYNRQIDESGCLHSSKRNRFIGDAVVSMLYLIRDEIEELGLIDNPFMQPLFVTVFGSETTASKTTGADFQLDIFAKSKNNMVVLLKKLAEITRECCTNWLYDPLEGMPKLPAWLCWWKGIEPEIVVGRERVFAGQEAEFKITVMNSSDHEIVGIGVNYSVEDSDRNLVAQNVHPITRIESGEVHIIDVSFKTRPGVTAYNVIATVGVAGREIPVSATLNTYWVNASLRPTTTTQFADGKAPVLYEGEIETNYPAPIEIDSTVEVIAPSKEMSLTQSQKRMVLGGNGILLLHNSDFSPLIIPADALEGVERCRLRMTINDREGTRIFSNISKPFYVGFTGRPVHISLSSTIDRVVHPGDTVPIELSISGQGTKKFDDAKVDVSFVADSGKNHKIELSSMSDIPERPVVIHWRVPTLEGTPRDRSGVIRATLWEGLRKASLTESERFMVSDEGVLMNIDSLRVPDRARIGEEISGWLRIRRNVEEGKPATLKLWFNYKKSEPILAIEQPVNQARNLSLAFGPLEIPEHDDSESDQVEIIAEILYDGRLLDRRSAFIMLKERSLARTQVSFSGIPNFVKPDEKVSSVIHLNNQTENPERAEVSVKLESIVRTESLMTREILLEPDRFSLLPVEFRVPISAEMSTAHLIVDLNYGNSKSSHKKQFKVKAIDNPVFDIRFQMRDERGKPILSLVPRVTPVKMAVEITSRGPGLENLHMTLRIMTRRDLSAEFHIPFDTVDNGVFQTEIDWTTPPVDVITNFYLDVVMSQYGRQLPSRALDVEKKQFTVY